MTRLKRILPGFLGLAIFLYILYSLDLEKVSLHILAAGPVFLLYSVLVIAVGLLLRGLKWQTIIGHYGKPPGLFESTRIFCVGTMVGFLTPLKAGVFLRALFIRGIGLSKAIASVFIDRAIDLGFVALIAAFGFLFLQEGLLFTGLEKIALVAVLALGVVFLLVIKGVRAKALKFLRDLLSFVKDRKRLSISVGLAPIIFLSSVLSYFLVALSLGINVSPGFFVFLVAVIMLVEALPVTFFGLGTREAAMIFLLSGLGVAPELAVALSLLYTLLNYCTLSAIGITKLLAGNQGL